jgi:hypothetical protein
MTLNNFSRFSKLFLVLNFTFICSTGLAKNAKKCQPLPLKTTSILSEADVLGIAKKAVQSYNLTSIANECLAFQILKKNEKKYLVNVREKHSGECGGDPMVEPRLFSLYIEKNKHLTTDAYSPAMKFEALSCKKKIMGN